MNVTILKQPIELFKVLKFTGIVSSGGEAKTAIENGEVMVNDRVETQKRKKILAGDIIKFREHILHIDAQ